jgi:hypothetical protein
MQTRNQKIEKLTERKGSKMNNHDLTVECNSIEITPAKYDSNRILVMLTSADVGEIVSEIGAEPLLKHIEAADCVEYYLTDLLDFFTTQQLQDYLAR